VPVDRDLAPELEPDDGVEAQGFVEGMAIQVWGLGICSQLRPVKIAV
jgi:hypothetical protein